jgi:hypothetical protein
MKQSKNEINYNNNRATKESIITKAIMQTSKMKEQPTKIWHCLQLSVQNALNLIKIDTKSSFYKNIM